MVKKINVTLVNIQNFLGWPKILDLSKCGFTNSKECI